MQIYLIRHTAVYNPDKLCYGQSNIALSANWEQHFEELKQKLGSELNGAQFFSSPFKRCTQLTGALSASNFKTDIRLAEMNFGKWEQQPWDIIDQTILNAWMADYVHYQVPGGESFALLHERCTAFWKEMETMPLDKIAIITHGGVIRSILAAILSMPLNRAFQVQIDYSSVSKVSINKAYGNYHMVEYINR